MVAKVDNIVLTIVAAFAFFAATVGINMVANLYLLHMTLQT